jgi:hypothetical protein
MLIHIPNVVQPLNFSKLSRLPLHFSINHIIIFFKASGANPGNNSTEKFFFSCEHVLTTREFLFYDLPESFLNVWINLH